MPVLRRLFRNTPGICLKDYFAAKTIVLSEAVNWNGNNATILRPLLRAVSSLSEREREIIRADAERVDRMTSEVGQAAIMAVASEAQQDTLRTIETRHARALWLFLNDFGRFERAEDAAFFDNARLSRTWDGFTAPCGLGVSRDQAHLDALAAEVQTLFGEGQKVKVEVFDRTRPDVEHHPHQLIQVTVFREGLADCPLVFQGDELERLVYRPVHELAFTYEPATGVIEVVAKQKMRRSDLAKVFARALLGLNIEGERIPLRHYDLSVFMAEREFATDPEDGIVDVRPRLVKFETFDGRTFVTIEARTEEETVHAAARGMFGERDPFIAGGVRIREVMLAVSFRPDHTNPGGKTVSIKLRHPNGCDLKDKTEKERKIGEKYLRRWEILTEQSIG